MKISAESPKEIFVEEFEKYVKELSGVRNLKEFSNLMPDDIYIKLVSLIETSKNKKEIQSQESKDKLYGLIRTWYTIINCTEFVIDLHQNDRFKNYIEISEKEIDSKVFNKVTNLNFFDNMVITFKYDKGFLLYFIIVNKADYERIKENGNRETVYEVSLIHHFNVNAQFIYIPSSFPKLYNNCKKYKSCNNFIKSSITLTNEAIEGMQDGLCIKSWRTAGSCPTSDNLSKILEDNIDQPLSFRDIFGMFSFVHYSLNCYQNRKYVTLFNDKIQTNKENAVQKADIITHTKQQSVIYLVDEFKHYINPEKRVGKGGTHASPAEHLRRSHERRTKSGKIVTVKECTINKGKGKVTYKISNT